MRRTTAVGSLKASDFALRAFCEVPNPSRRQGLVGSVYSPSLAGATVYHYSFLLATPTTPTMALPGTSGLCSTSLGPWNVTGAKCSAVVVVQASSGGRYSTGFSCTFRYSVPSWLSAIGSSSLSLCCKSNSEERSAGNPHAAFCGSRRRATASGHPVRLETKPRRGVRHRNRRKPPATATPFAYRHRASRRLYTNVGATLKGRARPSADGPPAS